MYACLKKIILFSYLVNNYTDYRFFFQIIFCYNFEGIQSSSNLRTCPQPEEIPNSSLTPLSW